MSIHAHSWRCLVMGVRRVESGRLWAWLLLLVGGGVSIAVSVGHAHLRAAEGSGPSGWAIGWAVLVPLLLFVADTGITAIPWPRERRWMLLRWCGALPVAVLSGYVSWAHISGLLTAIGEDRLVSVLAPLAVNGLMFIGASGVLATGRNPRRPAPVAASSSSPVGSAARSTSSA